MLLGTALAAGPVHAQKLIPIPMAGFAFPTMQNVVDDVILANGFDKKNGLKLDVHIFGSGGALFAALSTGEIVCNGLSVYHIQKMRAQGVPITTLSTMVSLDSLQVVTRQPDIKRFADLKGKTFAATMAFAEYQYLKMYGSAIGLNLGKDVTVINATPSLARAQLRAKRVDAIMAWEPGATMVLDDDPGHRVILTGSQAWKKVAGIQGWQLVTGIREDYLKKYPGAGVKVLNMWRDAAAFLRDHPDKVDEIVTSGKYTTKKMPKGVLARALKSRRLFFDVRPAWDPDVNRMLWKALEVGVAHKYIPSLPAKAAILSKPPA